MKAYLEEFFKIYSYEPKDAAYLMNVYERIEAHRSAQDTFQKAIAAYESTDCDHARVLHLADEAAQAVGVHEYSAELLIYICLSKYLKERYRARGIREEIFDNSILDLRYKLEECKAVKGVVGSFVATWFAGFFEMTRFALGRLQFELIPFGEYYEKDGKSLTPDSTVINVHIPRTGTPLDVHACQEAYRAAAVFFADRIEGDIAFVCHSWLLYPENETILSVGSNIVHFMKQYDLLRWGIDKNRSDLWRLFDTEESHPDRLPTDTTARRLYVEHIKAGGKVGWGFGVFWADALS